MLNQDILARAKLRVQSFSGLNGDAIITSVELTMFDQDAIAGFWIEAVIIGTGSVCKNTLNVKLFAIHRIVLPKRCIPNLVLTQKHPLTTDELNHMQWDEHPHL